MDQLHALGKSYDNDMAINLINRSLNKDFGDFVRINMHCVGKTVTELHTLLIDYEKGLKDKAPTPQVLTIQKGMENKPKPQANKKDKSKGKTDKNKKVLDTGRGTAPFTSKTCKKIRTRLSVVLQHQGFKEEKKLSYGEQYLQVGNGAQAAVEAIGVFDLVLPSGLVLKLNNCHYAPSIIRGYMDQLHALGKSYDNDMAINLINRSLNKDFGDFVRNFNMHCVGKTVTELHALLTDYEKGLKDKAPTPQRKENPNKDQTCHHCHVAGHWKRNCPLYLEELRKNKDKAEHGATASRI
nr:hypothetical protein [Tanacetum cinerariifolium]